MMLRVYSTFEYYTHSTPQNIITFLRKMADYIFSLLILENPNTICLKIANYVLLGHTDIQISYLSLDQRMIQIMIYYILPLFIWILLYKLDIPHFDLGR